MDYSVTVNVFALVGGKKKPLKAPKKQNKEMDEVSSSVPLRLVKKGRKRV